MFLFQIGSIKSYACFGCPRIEPKFLFQIGSIKSGIEIENPYTKKKVSIPNWFD